MANPVGIYSLLAEGGYHAGKSLENESKRIDAIQDPETQEMEMENFIKTIKGY